MKDRADSPRPRIVNLFASGKGSTPGPKSLSIDDRLRERPDGITGCILSSSDCVQIAFSVDRIAAVLAGVMREGPN